MKKIEKNYRISQKKVTVSKIGLPLTGSLELNRSNTKISNFFAASTWIQLEYFIFDKFKIHPYFQINSQYRQLFMLFFLKM